MGTVHIGLNAEYSRSSDKPFEWAVEQAARMGYKWFEPMVHFGRELMMGINYDSGNAYLAGEDVYAWLDRGVERLVHFHAKDIATEHSDAERGKVTGTPVGCACGEGVLDWDRIVKTVQDQCPRDIVFSVECGTPEQAEKSLEHRG